VDAPRPASSVGPKLRASHSRAQTQPAACLALYAERRGTGGVQTAMPAQATARFETRGDARLRVWSRMALSPSSHGALSSPICTSLVGWVSGWAQKNPHSWMDDRESVHAMHATECSYDAYHTCICWYASRLQTRQGACAPTAATIKWLGCYAAPFLALHFEGLCSIPRQHFDCPRGCTSSMARAAGVTAMGHLLDALM